MKPLQPQPKIGVPYIKRIPPLKAPGKDRIQRKVLAKLPRKPIVNLYCIYNACIQQQYFPTQWKEAIFMPIPKPKNDADKPENLSHISLLSKLGKILEQLLHLTYEDHGRGR